MCGGRRCAKPSTRPPTSIDVSPSQCIVPLDGSKQFTAIVKDQFGHPMDAQPTVAWSITSGPGTIGSAGRYTGTNSGVATIRAATSGIAMTATVNVTQAAAAITPNVVVLGTTAQLTVGAPAGSGGSSVIYTWTVTSMPAGASPPQLSDNASSTANNVTAAFTSPGAYNFLVTIDHEGVIGTGEVSATVEHLAPPTALSVVSVPGSGGQLTWNAANGATIYDIYRKSDGGNWLLIGSATATSYADTTVTSDGKFAYGVVSRNDADSSAMEQTALNLVLTAAGDYDHDGLDNLTEYNGGTNPANFDTDGDLLPDGWEVDSGLDATDSDENSNGISDQNDDFDGDGLTNLAEYNHSANPSNTDTDGDGTSDGVEASQGSDPSDASDGGQAPASDMKAQFTLTVGDSSGSQSERWSMHVGDKIQHTAPGYGQVDSGNYYFKAGESYDITLEHLGTRPDYLAQMGGPNYDWLASVTEVGSTLPFWIDDPYSTAPVVQGMSGDQYKLLQEHIWNVIGDPNLTYGKVAHLHIPQLDADVDSKNDSGFTEPDNNDEEDRLEQDPSTGKIVFASTGDLDEDGIVDSQDNRIDGPACMDQCHFVPMTLRLSENINEAQYSQIDISINYDSSKLRIWKPGKDASSARTSGDIIASGTNISASSLGLSPGGSVVVFIEALNADPSPLEITATAAVAGTKWSGTVSDKVHVVATEVELLADTNRDGEVNDYDSADKNNWTAGANGHGAIVLLNSDRDCATPRPGATCLTPDNFAGGMDWDFDRYSTNEPPNNVVDDGGDIDDLAPLWIAKLGVNANAIPNFAKVVLSMSVPAGETGFMSGFSVDKRLRIFMPDSVDGNVNNPDREIKVGSREALGPGDGTSPNGTVSISGSSDFRVRGCKSKPQVGFWRHGSGVQWKFED